MYVYIYIYIIFHGPHLIGNRKGALQKGGLCEFASEIRNLRGGFANETRMKNLCCC